MQRLMQCGISGGEWEFTPAQCLNPLTTLGRFTINARDSIENTTILGAGICNGHRHRCTDESQTLDTNMLRLRIQDNFRRGLDVVTNSIKRDYFKRLKPSAQVESFDAFSLDNPTKVKCLPYQAH
jgi:hypothetical protein